MKAKEIIGIVVALIILLIVSVLLSSWIVTAYFLGPIILIPIVYFLSKIIISSSNTPKLSALWLKYFIPIVATVGYVYGFTALGVSEFNFSFSSLLDFSNILNLAVSEGVGGLILFLIVLAILSVVTVPFIHFAELHNTQPKTNSNHKVWVWAGIIILIIFLILNQMITNNQFMGVALIPVGLVLVPLVLVATVVIVMRSKK